MQIVITKMSQVFLVWITIVFVAVTVLPFSDGSKNSEKSMTITSAAEEASDSKTKKDRKIFNEGGDAPFRVAYQSQGSSDVLSGILPPGCQCVLQGQCRNLRVSGIAVNEPVPIKANQQVFEIAPGKSTKVSAIADGSADVIDLRVLNKPGQCPEGQHVCCPNSGVVYPGPGCGTSGGPAGVRNGYVTCGSRQIIFLPTFNVGFGQARLGAYPWMAVLLDKANNAVGAGALISPQYVLTVAHKVQGRIPGTDMKVRFGNWSTIFNLQPYRSVVIDVAGIDIHPEFDPSPSKLYNNIALIKLKEPVDLNSYPHIKSVCLPPQDSNYDKKRCWVAGFRNDVLDNGKNATLMKEVYLPVVNGVDCEKILKTRLGLQFELNKKSFICAGGEEGKDACDGDGGSPLVCETDGKWIVAGLVAWGVGCAQNGIPAVYVNVPNYVTWIQSKLNA